MLYECPVCQYLSLPERGMYSICEVCNWEDDASDVDASLSIDGPNGNLTVDEAKNRFASRVDVDTFGHKRIKDLSKDELESLISSLTKEIGEHSNEQIDNDNDTLALTQKTRIDMLKKAKESSEG